jgi:hypothetical protein
MTEHLLTGRFQLATTGDRDLAVETLGQRWRRSMCSAAMLGCGNHVFGSLGASSTHALRASSLRFPGDVPTGAMGTPGLEGHLSVSTPEILPTPNPSGEVEPLSTP